MAKKPSKTNSPNGNPESPDDMLATKKMLDLTEAAFTSKLNALDSKMESGFSRLEGRLHGLDSRMHGLEEKIHLIATETSRILLLMEQQRSENRMFFEAFGLTRDRHGILESRVERIEKKLGI